MNWRKYCASSPSSSFSPLEDGTPTTGAAPSEVSAPAAATAAVVAGERQTGGRPVGEEGKGADLEQFVDLPPVCILFALCETGGGRGDARTGSLRSTPGIGASELQPLIWQLLELTLRPEDSLAEWVAALPLQPVPTPAAVGLPPRGSGPADGETGSSGVADGAVSGDSSGKRGEGEGVSPATAVAVAAAADVGTGSAGTAAADGGVQPPSLARALVTGVVLRAQSPADLLIQRGLVGPDALVEMAQDLLSPAAGAEARKRTARVLHHLWTASAAESRPEVREHHYAQEAEGYHYGSEVSSKS